MNGKEVKFDAAQVCRVERLESSLDGHLKQPVSVRGVKERKEEIWTAVI